MSSVSWVWNPALGPFQFEFAKLLRGVVRGTPPSLHTHAHNDVSAIATALGLVSVTPAENLPCTGQAQPKSMSCQSAMSCASYCCRFVCTSQDGHIRQQPRQTHKVSVRTAMLGLAYPAGMDHGADFCPSKLKLFRHVTFLSYTCQAPSLASGQ